MDQCIECVFIRVHFNETDLQTLKSRMVLCTCGHFFEVNANFTEAAFEKKKTGASQQTTSRHSIFEREESKHELQDLTYRFRKIKDRVDVYFIHNISYFLIESCCYKCGKPLRILVTRVYPPLLPELVVEDTQQ